MMPVREYVFTSSDCLVNNHWDKSNEMFLRIFMINDDKLTETTQRKADLGADLAGEAVIVAEPLEMNTECVWQFHQLNTIKYT